MRAGVVRADLLARTAQLVDIPSPSHEEGALADFLESELSDEPWLRVERVGANVVARTNLGRDRRVVLAGHLDTVPFDGRAVSHVDGDVVRGVGATDMKGGLAVIAEVARTVSEPAIDVTYVFYACEEVDPQLSGLLQIEAERPDLLVADAAILGEPTAGVVEAGCQGTMRLAVTLRGERAHTARPWSGSNAIHRLSSLLEVITSYEARRPVVDGCEYRESLQAVKVEGGVAGNVVPDRARLVVNHRFAPDVSVAEATRRLQSMMAPALGPEDSVEVESCAPAARPYLDNPLLAALVRSTGGTPRAKLGWTDVAFFAQRGVPAANFGPGDPELAHTPRERIERGELEACYAGLVTLVSQGERS